MKIVSNGHFKSIDQFKLIEDKKLGNGSFGVVKLAVHKCTNKMYAIKIINIQSIPSEVEIKLIEREIKLHSQIVHPHIITLWDTLIDEHNIYMILDYAENGNLFYYQNTKNTFSESEAFMFFCQTVKAVDNLHKNDIMHRDLKPENLLLDQYWNIKICDLGWCAENISTKRNTFCGTYEYMSPEMLFNTSYDYHIDIWALGILLYEMVHGYAPFKGDSVNQVKEKMLRGSFQINEDLSDPLKELITNLLKFQPLQRLTIKQILSSEWVTHMEQVIHQHTNQMNNYDPKSFHHIISKIEIQQYIVKKKNKHSKIQNSLSKISLGKNVDSFHKKHQTQNQLEPKSHTKNISFNFSINNFGYIKNTDRVAYISPDQIVEKRKKKQEKQKRYKTHIDEQLFDLPHAQSPNNAKRQKKNKDSVIKKEEKFSRKQSQKVISKLRKSRDYTDKDKSILKMTLDNVQFVGRSPSKISSIITKKSVRDKLTSAVSSSKNLRRIKTKDKGNLTNNLSNYNY